jgi:CheY-like chemotaxis protein
MKIEICCPDCDGGYLVDAEALEAGLPCPGCGRALDGSPDIVGPVANDVHVDLPAASETNSPAAAPVEVPVEASVEVPVEVPIQAPVQAPAAAPDPGAVTAPQVAVQAAVAVAPQAVAITEVVCPRCNLHFKPRADSQARVRASGERPTVLIVEDLVYFREIAAEALESEYAIQAVATKDGARAALDRGGVDLMVLDLTLDGGEGGLDLLRELKAKPCPILIYTAQDESEMYGDSWDELQRLGADDIVLKGMNVGDELTRKIASLLGNDPDGNE